MPYNLKSSLNSYWNIRCFRYNGAFSFSGEYYEKRHTSEIRQSRGSLRLRQHLWNPQHRKRNPRGNLLGLPPVLYRQTEIRGHRRPSRKIPEEIRNGLFQKAKKVVCPRNYNQGSFFVQWVQNWSPDCLSSGQKQITEITLCLKPTQL